MNKLFMAKLAGVVIIASSVIGCSSIPLKQGAEKVLVSSQQPDKSCKFLGQVSGSQGNLISGQYTSNKNLQAGAMNDLRNQAVALGGNYVQLLSNTAAQSGSYQSAVMQTNVVTTGNVFKCPNQ